MDPRNPASFNHRSEKLSTGRTYHFVDQLPNDYDPKTTKTLLCVHGFPDLWYGWRFQIGPWTRSGYRVIAPDMLGYGGTDSPTEPSEYSTKRLSDDLSALLDLVGVSKAIIIGHDWGSFTVGRFALWHPERLLALIMLSVPYTPPSPNYISVQEVAQRAPNLGYQVYFSEGQSTHEIESNLAVFLGLIFHPPREGASFTGLGELREILLGNTTLNPNQPSVLKKPELEYYHNQFGKGMQGPLSYYRTAKFRHDEEQAANLPSNLRPDLPVLFLWGTEDPTATPTQIQRARKWIPRLQDIALKGKGHWVMVEASDVVTESVLRWLDGLALNAKGKL
jgi:soluble epoxide hydrolase/lipid-phosphate phosphatase